MPETELLEGDRSIATDDDGTSISLGKPFAVVLITEIEDGYYELFSPEFGIVSNLSKHPMDCWRECRDAIESGIVNKAYELRIEREKEEVKDGSSENSKDENEENDADSGGGGTSTIDPEG